MDSSSNPLRPAATLILLRERAGLAPEVLMLERSAGMAFAAGALVFPGGRVDDADLALATRLGLDLPLEDVAARLGAIRETIEETGVAVGLDPYPDAETILSLRAILAEGGSLADALARHALSLDINGLHSFARWIPPLEVPKRYDTRFYIATAPESAVEHADGSESVHALWASADAFLEGLERGEHAMLFPTRMNLLRLRQFASFDEIRDDAARHGGHIVNPRVEIHNDEKHLVIDKGLGYPITLMPLRLTPRG